MITVLEADPSPQVSDTDCRVRLKTWAEARAYFKKHLKPVDYSPKGHPIYSKADIEALNVILPEELWP